MYRCRSERQTYGKRWTERERQRGRQRESKDAKMDGFYFVLLTIKIVQHVGSGPSQEFKQAFASHL